MKKIVSIILFIGILFSSYSMKAQRAERANKYYESFAYQKAIELYEVLWEKDSLNESYTNRLATSNRLINNSKQSEHWYSRLVKMPNTDNKNLLYYARALQSNKKYKQAQIWMNKYLDNEPSAELYRIDPSYIADLMQDSSRYQIKAINANSDASDFGVSFYQDQLVFSSARKRNTLIKRTHKWNNQDYLRLYGANIEVDGELVDTHLFSNKLATNYHDGPVCFNDEGNEMFITRNNVSNSKRIKRNEEGIVGIKLYHSIKKDKKWSRPELLPFNMKAYSTGQPALSADAKSLYFISNRPGGFGGTDLYVSHRGINGWGEAENLGSNINTSENEMFPFVTENNYLYFASKGHAGLGGLDIFQIDLNNKNTKPINLGYPINTSQDDFNFILRNGKGYLSSNRLKGESYDDIYQFTIVSKLLKGQVINSITKEILGETQVSLLNLAGDTIKQLSTNKDGKFKFLIPEVNYYQVRSIKEKYTDGELSLPASTFQNKTESNVLVYQTPDTSLYLAGLVLLTKNETPIEAMNITVQEQDSEEILRLLSDTIGKFSCQLKRETIYNIKYQKEGLLSKEGQISTLNIPENIIYVSEYFDKLHIGQTLINHILYDNDKSNIREDAAIELDKLVLFMDLNPRIKIELSSHTDSRGSDSYNLALSKRRAKSAVAYIISKGISSDRIIAKGYGETKLINQCSNGVRCSKAEHQANRRTELKILGI